MSMGLESILQSTPTGDNIALEMGDIKLQYNAALDDLKVVSASFESYMNACERYLALCDCVEANEGMLEPAVRDFVNHNGELAMALGIDLAMEDDSQDAQKENGEKVTEKKQGFFRRIWEGIKAFFKRIIQAIGNFFHWIGNIFNPIEKKVDAIEKNTQQIIEAISKNSGDINKNIAKEDIEYDTNSNNDPQGQNVSRELVLETPAETIKLIESFTYILDQFASSNVEQGLSIGAIVTKHMEADVARNAAHNATGMFHDDNYIEEFNNRVHQTFNNIAEECNKLAHQSKNLITARVTNTNSSNSVTVEGLEINAPAKIRLVCPSNIKTNDAISFFVNNGWTDTQWLQSGIRKLYDTLDKGKHEIQNVNKVMETLNQNLSELEKKTSPAPVSTEQKICKTVISVYKSTAQAGMKLLATYGHFITAFDGYLNDLISLARAKGINVLER